MRTLSCRKRRRPSARRSTATSPTCSRRCTRSRPEAVGLDTFGRPGNYYERQISRWSKQYVASRTEDIPEMDALMDWLPRHIPAATETVVVHGDYRLGNAIVHPREPRMVAVLDWELSTLGHPLADLGYVCQTYYADEDDQHGLNRPNLPSSASRPRRSSSPATASRRVSTASRTGTSISSTTCSGAPRSSRGCTSAVSTATRAPTPPSVSRATAGCGRSGRGGSRAGTASRPETDMARSPIAPYKESHAVHLSWAAQASSSRASNL